MANFPTIQQLIERHAESSPEQIAAIDGDTCYSYRAINQHANQLAHYLLTFAPAPESIIAIAMDRSPATLAAILAILKTGCAYLPLDAKTPCQRLHYFLQDSAAPILITESKYAHQFTDYTGKIVFIDLCSTNTLPTVNPTITVKPTQLAYIIYTSGSTGSPKGVMLEQRSVINYIDWLKQYTNCQQQDIIDFSGNINFDMAVTSTIAALALGLRIAICPDTTKQNIKQYLQYLQQHNIAIIKITPGYLRMMLAEADESRPALPFLKTIIVGGEILPAKDCAAWLTLYPAHRIFNEYGPTETTVAVSQYTVTAENVAAINGNVPIGKPGLNIEFKLDNEELLIGGNCLARGYLNQPDLTAERFNTHYKSGDRCILLPDGNFECIGRMDEQVKIHGYRVEPGEVTACMLSHPLVKEAVVIAYEGQLVAYYTSQDSNLNEKQLRAHLHQHLTAYMIPAFLIKVGQFPLNANGKLDKQALPKPALQFDKKITGSALEKQVLTTWRKAFANEQLDINSNFFSLGGHSLIATKIAADIQQNLGKQITPTDIYRAPTVTDLADLIKQAKPISNADNIEHTSHSFIPLSDFQMMIWLSNLFEPKVKKLNMVTQKRLLGKIDTQALLAAITDIIKKHEIFSYAISDYIPRQTLKKKATIWFIENDLSQCNAVETAQKINDSLQHLATTKWDKTRYALLVKLFHLNHEQSEIQIAVPHILFDDASLELLMQELSTAYLAHIHQQNRTFPRLRYSDYVWQEKQKINQQLPDDIKFWQSYWQDTSLMAFAKHDVIENMHNQPYSTYLNFPQHDWHILMQHCAKLSVTITDLLTAATTIALQKTNSHLNDNICINIVKSTRTENVSRMLGCMLQLDAVKVNLKSPLPLFERAKEIYTSRVFTEPHQACSGMVKLACLDKSYCHQPIRQFLINKLSQLYCSIAPDLQLNAQMLAMYGRLPGIRNNFLVNINIFNNFIMAQQHLPFGLPLAKREWYPKDLLQINRVLDVCFFRDDLGKAYLVISGNIKPSLREKIGTGILTALEQTTVTNPPTAYQQQLDADVPA